ncbi:MAG: hypothetical protein U0872_03145 [Planctomycetaceae bacterium]
MTRQLVLWVMIGVAGGGALVAGFSALPKLDADAGPLTVYICRKTGDLFVSRTLLKTQHHPETGLATWRRGVYCPQCGEWKSSPPPDRLYGHPELLHCPKCRTPRTFEGEIPDGTMEL